MYREFVRTFLAIGSDGTNYTIKAFRNRLGPHEVSEPGASSDDPSSWRYYASFGGTGDGWEIRRLAKGRYEFVDKAVTLTSGDPSAA